MDAKHVELPIFGNVELTSSNAPDWEYKHEAHLKEYAFGEIAIDIRLV